MTGAGSITLHLLVLCVLAIWMAKRTVRASRPLAISLLFGLASSTLLTVLVIPAIYIILRDDGRPASRAKSM